MRRLARTLLLLSVALGITLIGRAGDNPAAAVIEKAIKAHSPKGVDTKNQGVRTKSKGTLHVMGLDLAFTNEVAVQAPNKFKESMELDVMGNKINVVSVFNGKEGWIRTGDKDIDVTEDILNEFKEAAYVMRLMQGLFLKDKAVKFSLVGDVKVKGKGAVGVTISRDGKKDVNVFFDKGTGLISKIEMRRHDAMSGQEVLEERYILSYQDLAGRKVAKNVEVLRDGNAFLEVEVTDMQVLEKIDDSEFARPK